MNMKDSHFRQVLANQNFLKLWGSQVLSQATIHLINFILVLRIFEVTGSTSAVALIFVFFALPAVLLGPFSGAITDFLDKRQVMMATNFLEALVIPLYLLVKAKIWPIYTVVFLYSLIDQLYLPAEASSLPALVPKKLLPAANSLFLFGAQGAFLVGFALAGPFLRFFGREAPFLIASFLMLMATFFVFSLPAQRLAFFTNGRLTRLSEFFQQVREGYLLIRKEPMIFFPLLLIVLAYVMMVVLGILTPSFATEILKIELLDVSILVLPVGIGAILGAQAVVWSLKRTRKKKVLSCGLFLSAIILLFLGLLFPQFSHPSLLLSILLFLLLGASYVAIVIPVQTLLQEVTPHNFRGRIFGVLGFLMTLASILPILLLSALTDVLGVRTIVVLVSLIIWFLAVFSLREQYAIYARYRS